MDDITDKTAYYLVLNTNSILIKRKLSFVRWSLLNKVLHII